MLKLVPGNFKLQHAALARQISCGLRVSVTPSVLSCPRKLLGNRRTRPSHSIMRRETISILFVAPYTAMSASAAVWSEQLAQWTTHLVGAARELDGAPPRSPKYECFVVGFCEDLAGLNDVILSALSQPMTLRIEVCVGAPISSAMPLGSD